MPFARVIARARSIFARSAPGGLPAPNAHDSLTGLLTWSGLLGLERTWLGTTGAVVLFDLDHFRHINTALDTAGGNQVLIEVARRLGSFVPKGAITARTGSDEFAILLPRADALDAEQFASGLVREIGRPIAAGPESLAVSISIGVAEPEAHESLEGVLRRAGSAMRRQQDSTPSHAAPALSSVTPDALRQRFAMERELRAGLVSGQLRLFYQPIVNLATYVAVEFEALLRWDHPERGTLLPGDFLFDVASDALHCEVGRWVLREACQQGTIWRDCPGSRPLTIAVNLSSSQIRDPLLLDDIDRILGETRFEPGSLRLEISESITLDEITSAVCLVRGLRQRGIGIALDDFGAGNAGWTLLRQSQVDVIKLDQSFVPVAEHAQRDSVRMIEALAGFAQQLGMVVSIEGIEDADQAETMRQVGVDQGQGFYFAPPQPAELISPLLSAAPLRALT